MGAKLSPAAKEKIEAARKTRNEDMNLSGCSIRTFPKELLQIPGLRRLNMSKNFLHVIPPWVIKFEHLEEMNISFNDLVGVAHELQSLPSLQSLTVEGNTELSFLPDFPRLTSLDVSGTSIGPIPDHMHLRALVELGACAMRLESLPARILELSSLRVLRLANNRIRGIPPEIARCANLERLDLSSNPLTALPAAIGDLSHLTHLLLSQSELHELPAEVARLERLTVFDIRMTQIEVFDVSVERMSQLREFLASSGHLREIGHNCARSLPGLKAIETIDLANNRLAVLPKEIGYLSTLRKLELQQNQLAVLPGEINYFNDTIQLNLAGNPLRHPFCTLLQEGGILNLLQNVVPFCSSYAPRCTMGKVDAVQAHTPVSFRVQAADFKGRPRQTGKEPFAMRIVRKDGPSAGTVVESFLRDNHEKKEPGTYDCHFNLPEPGTYEVTVTLEDTHIAGSPFTVVAS